MYKDLGTASKFQPYGQVRSHSVVKWEHGICTVIHVYGPGLIILNFIYLFIF